MKKQLTSLSLLVCLISGMPIFSQDCPVPAAGTYLNGNNIRALIRCGGSLFFDGNDAQFQVPVPGPTHTIFAQGLWLGAVDPAGNLKLAAQTYGLNSGRSDFYPGPLDEEGGTTAENCRNWDRVWSVGRYQIEAHLQDFADNGAIDAPIPEIMGWPGKGNPYFADLYGFELPFTTQGLAPFFDQDGDGLYDPMAGDYPMIRQSAVLPEQITWSIFNDAGGFHLDSRGDPLHAEIQLTTWAYKCTDNPQLGHTIFTSYKVINRGVEPLDSLHLGLWADFDLGCYRDDFIGSAPELNTAYTYNGDNDDQVDCPAGITGYGENPPVQAMTVLNQELSYLMYYNNSGVGTNPFGTTDPNSPLEYYRYLTGHWRDGTPLTFGGSGYQSGPVTNLAFPDNPNDLAGWSALFSFLDEGDWRIVGSVRLEGLAPGNLAEVDVAYSYFREPGADYLGNVNAMYEGIESLHSWYASGFESHCSLAATCTDDCVWAGDANADGIANHCDLLAIGMAETAQGPTRGAPYNWSPQTGENWPPVQANGANYKHLDADGNGIVAFEDFFLTEQHYNLTRPGYQPPAPAYREGPELLLEAAGSMGFDDLYAGHMPILATLDLTVDIPGLYALAFSIEYDTAYFESAYSLQDGYSLAGRTFQTGPDGEALPGQFDYARVSGGAIGVGRLALMRFEVKDAFLYPLPADSTLIRFKNIKAFSTDGTAVDIGGTTVVARFPGVVVVGTDSPSTVPSVHVFPNPTDGRLEMRFPGQQAEEITILDAAGKPVWRRRGLFTDGASLDLGGLPGGVYFVRMQIGGAAVVRRVVLR